ncbi:MAG TPA: hypothetical protein VF131_20770 [Blastocatellia bacterium]|nr:hypothetical protein [Blastocatellia bacterium]
MLNKLFRSFFITMLLLFLSDTILAQNEPLNGIVTMRNPDGTSTPVAGAIIDIYRTDGVNYHWERVTDKNGRFVAFGMNIQGRYLVVASGAGIQFGWAFDPRGRSKGMGKNLPDFDITVRPGDGRRPTFDEVKEQVDLLFMSPKDRARVIAERAEMRRREAARKESEAKVAEARALQTSFDQFREHFNKGIELIKASPPNHQAALSEFDAAAAIDPAKNAMFAELSYKANANLAESHYQIGVDLFNQKKRDEAKLHFEQGIKAIDKAISVATSSIDTRTNSDLLIYYGILAKTAKILVKVYSITDLIDPTVTALDKAAAIDADKDKWRNIQDELRRAPRRKN